MSARLAKTDYRDLASRIRSLRHQLSALLANLEKEFGEVGWESLAGNDDEFNIEESEARFAFSGSDEAQSRFVTSIHRYYAAHRRRWGPPTSLLSVERIIPEMDHLVSELEDLATDAPVEDGVARARAIAGCFVLAALGIGVLNGVSAHLASIPPAFTVLAAGYGFWRS